MRFQVRRLALSFLAVAAVARAQTASWVEVIADQSQVVVGRTLQLSAVVHDSVGNVLPNAPVTWSVNQSAASISSTGLVTAKGLATVRATAKSGSVSGEGAFQCVPSKLEVTPGVAVVNVGTTSKFQAAAYDADGKVISGVTFSWSLTNQRQGGSSLGSIDSTGSLKATGEGGIWVWATYNYNETFPGLQQRWVAYANVYAQAPPAYSVKKLYSTMSQTRSSWKLRPKQSMIYSTDDGQLFFNASFDGLANALVNWNNGAWQVVSAGGVPRFGRASTALEFRTHAITRDGQILSYEDTTINGTELNLGNKDGLDSFINGNVPLGATEAVGSLYINRSSLTSTGWKMVRASFRYPNETVGYTGMFRGATGADEMLLSTRDTLPEIANGFSIDADFGIAGDGTAFYGVTNGSNRVFYRHDFAGRRKLAAVGDPIPTSTTAIPGTNTSKIRSFLGGKTYAPASWFDEDGTAIIGVVLEDNTQWYLSFAQDGKMSQLRISSQTGILWRNGSQGTLIYANPFGSQGNGIYMWKGSTATPLVLIGRKLFDQTVQDVESGTVDSSGRVVLMIRGDVNALIVARMDGTPFVLFQAGDVVNVELPVNLFTLIGGDRTGPPHVQAGGNSGSIGGYNGTDWDMTLGMGERLFGNTMWFGGSHGTTYNMRKAPNGDIWLITGAGIAKIVPGGQPQLVLPFPLKIDTLTVNNPGQLDVNGNGDVLFNSSTSAGDSRFFIWSNGTTKQILAYSSTLATATTIDGRIASSFDTFALDSQGRVIAQLRFRNVSLPSICIWDGSNWTTAAIPGSTKLGSHTVTNLPTIIKAAGPHLVAGLAVDNIGNILAEWTGSAWKTLVDIDTIMPNGQVANSISVVDVNTRGDVLFQFSNGVNSLVLLRNGVFRQVQDFFRSTPDGDYLLRINAMDLRDDGTIYFLAVNAWDEVVLYEADALN